jgi:hypothetical protein
MAKPLVITVTSQARQRRGPAPDQADAGEGIGGLPGPWGQARDLVGAIGSIFTVRALAQIAAGVGCR